MRDKNAAPYLWRQLRAIHSKSVRLDTFTLNTIMEYRGDNFSEKLRNYVFDHEKRKKS